MKKNQPEDPNIKWSRKKSPEIKPRPKFHPVYDDYYAVVIEDGSWLEFASTDQFWELFEYCDYQEKELTKSWANWQRQKEKVNEIQGVANKLDLRNAKLEKRYKSLKDNLADKGREIKELKELLSAPHSQRCTIGMLNTPDILPTICSCGLDKRIKQALKK